MIEVIVKTLHARTTRLAKLNKVDTRRNEADVSAGTGEELNSDRNHSTPLNLLGPRDDIKMISFESPLQRKEGSPNRRTIGNQNSAIIYFHLLDLRHGTRFDPDIVFSGAESNRTAETLESATTGVGMAKCTQPLREVPDGLTIAPVLVRSTTQLLSSRKAATPCVRIL